MSASSYSATKLALLGRKLWAQDGDLRTAEPIAIVGMSCRFPGGADSPEKLWNLLLEGTDAVTEVPADRWNADAWYDSDPATPGRMSSRWAGFLDDIRGFDAAFFDISPREAERMDPQQRLALEVACEAFERSGIPIDRLRGTAAGVYFASYHNDYTLLQYANPDTITARTLTGTLHAVVANRISYALGLRGPSLAIDSACSSSLVATHLACQALRTRDCDVALAGGVSIMATPHVTVALSKGGFMSPTGRCHTFDSDADGFVRAEGCGAVVLKRLADAIADGDEVLAVIRGSAVNQDGESTTLSAPNGLAQGELVRNALRNAGLQADQVSLIEAHGTGTELGDPIETDALASVFRGRDASAGPCWIGSIKSNVGHLEAAAGVAGLIKTVLCMQHRVVPPHALFGSLNRHIDLADGAMRVATAATPWNPAGSRIAGVSAFGVGGTNAHVLVEEPPAALERQAETVSGSFVLPVSARSEAALRKLCGLYAERLRDGVDAGELCRAAARGRMHHADWRVAPTGASADLLIQALDAIANGAQPIRAGRSADTSGICFVFTGQGSQWPGMARALREREPVFAAAFEDARAAILAANGPDVVAETERAADTTRLGDTDVAQAAIFAVQVALVKLLASRGIHASSVIGHSIGELAAAVAAGMLDLETAARAVVERGCLMQSTYDTGRMLSVRATHQVVADFVASNGLDVTIAAINGPTSIVLAGTTGAVQRTTDALRDAGIDHTALDVRFAFHSPLMADAADRLVQAAGFVDGTATRVPLYSTVTGRPLQRIDARYLADNVRSPVDFAGAVDAVLDSGATHFIEIGAHPALGRGIMELAEGRGATADVAFCLHRERDDRHTIRSLIGQAYWWGVGVEWSAEYPGAVRARVLPTYAWQHTQYWLPDAPDLSRPATAAFRRDEGFPGRRLSSAALTATVFELDMSDGALSALHDHRVGGEPRMPATAIAELIRSAAAAAAGAAVEVRGLGILRPLQLAREGRIQVVLHATADGHSAEVYAGDEHGWDRIATADAMPALPSAPSRTAETAHAGTGHAETGPAETGPAEAARDGTGERRVEIDSAEFYALLASHGCDFGDGFRLLHSISATTSEAHGEIRPNGSWQRGVHPAWTDAAAQLCVAVLHARGLTDAGSAFLPWSLDAFRANASGTAARGRAKLIDASESAATFDVELFSDDGRVMGELKGWRLRRTATAPSPLRSITWEASAAPATVNEETAAVTGRRWLVLPDATGVARRAADLLIAAGREVTLIMSDGADGGAAGAEAALALADEAGSWEGVLFCALGEPPEVVSGFDGASAAAHTLLPIARAVASGEAVARMVVVTRGTQSAAAPRRDVDPGGAAAWGIARALRAEAPAVRCICVDLDAVLAGADDIDADAQAVAAEALSAGNDAEVALRGGTRLVARDALDHARAVAAHVDAPVALVHRRPGTLDGIQIEAETPTPPPAGHVRIRVLAAAMNFRDVLTALGSYPGKAEMGHECCGIVDAVGEGVLTFDVGDRVMAFWPGSFRSFTNVPAAFVFQVPSELDPAGAATIPVAFGTAHYALHHIGRITQASTVLIHAGAGGVGLAAIQLAHAAGARVYATAGSPRKRALLERLGAAGVFDSRSPSFADAVLEATGGQGVDLVLNSLIGDMIPAGLRSLRSGGVFVELGKREMLSPDDAALARSDVRYAAFDLGDEARRNNELLPRIFRELTGLLALGRIRPLPATVHALSDAATAFRSMARAEHIGKVVLVPPTLATSAFDGWVVVTGGAGGVGMNTVRWLNARGARRIAVWGRRSPDAETASELARMSAETGAEIRAMQIDVSIRESVAAGLAELRRTAPVRGVIHAAAVIDDATLAQQDAQRLKAALAAKAAGAWNLHEATLRDPIELFVLYSAAGPVIDAKAQANYAAANAFVDALAVHRRGLALPAVSVLWGPWEGAGMAARLDDSARERWSRRGLEWWTASNATPAFDALLRDTPPQVLAVRTTGRRTEQNRAAPRAGGALRSQVAQSVPSMRHVVLAEHVAAAITGVLGIATPPGNDTPLRDAGLDSLSAIELRNALAQSAGMPLPATLAFDHPTINAIAAFLMRELKLEAELPKATAAIVEARPAVQVQDIDSLSDEEAEALLMAELGLNASGEAR